VAEAKRIDGSVEDSRLGNSQNRLSLASVPASALAVSNTNHYFSERSTVQVFVGFQRVAELIDRVDYWPDCRLCERPNHVFERSPGAD
jgi:hypothetical protein